MWLTTIESPVHRRSCSTTDQEAIEVAKKSKTSSVATPIQCSHISSRTWIERGLSFLMNQVREEQDPLCGPIA